MISRKSRKTVQLNLRMQWRKWPRTFRNQKSAPAIRAARQLRALLYQSDDLIRKISKTIAGKSPAS